MIKYIVAALWILISVQISFGQTGKQPTTAERTLSDSVCGCISTIDLSKITTKDEATDVITNCVGKKIDFLMAVANERKVELTDISAMNQIGLDMAAIMMKNSCDGFIKLSQILAKKDIENSPTTGSNNGTLKRIDDKGFNYFVMIDANNNETSFIWLRQFPGSEKFFNGISAFVGKKAEIKWQEVEVYLPQAKGYFKVKEITNLNFL